MGTCMGMNRLLVLWSPGKNDGRRYLPEEPNGRRTRTRGTHAAESNKEEEEEEGFRDHRWIPAFCISWSWSIVQLALLQFGVPSP